MALITDPDDLNQNTEITIDTSSKTIELSVAGNLSNEGVTGQALYSFLKEEWKNDSNLIPYAFPMISITPEQFEFIEDWVPANDTTRNLIRSAGWREITASDVLEREYMGIISLGEIDSSNTPTTHLVLIRRKLILILVERLTKLFKLMATRVMVILINVRTV